MRVAPSRIQYLSTAVSKKNACTGLAQAAISSKAVLNIPAREILFAGQTHRLSCFTRMRLF
ncbi:hypothetical protein I6F09_08790 [Bradyrhizobium sp. IC3195]|nr:hypothetical protein [Bradyrhizobium sp. IC3195]